MNDDIFHSELHDLEKRFEAFQQETRGRALKDQQALHRSQYGDQFAFFREGSALASVVTDEVGVILGKLKALSVAVKLPLLGELVESLYIAIEKQFVMFYNEMQEKIDDASGGSLSSSLQDDRPLNAVHRSRSSSTFSMHYDKRTPGQANMPLVEIHSPNRTPRLGGGRRGFGDPDAGPIGRSGSIMRVRGVDPDGKQNDDTATPLLGGTMQPNQSTLLAHSIKGLLQPATPPVTIVGPGGLAPSQKLTLSESMSTATALLTESLAVSLRCELVRLYMLDDKKNLVRAAEYPFPDMKDSNGPDLFSGNYTERGLAKALFSVVCEKGLAVSGVDARQATTEGDDPDQSGSSSTHAADPKRHLIRNCLVWPIILPSGHQRVAGMIHAINKEGAHEDERRRFTSEDEYSMHEAAKLFGNILERYPVKLFQVDIGSTIFKACHPDKVLIPHLPMVISDSVEGAQRIGNEIIRTNPHIIIYRGPMATIYKQGSRDKKSEDYVPAAGGALSTITTVEYNLEALNDLWKSGYDENVMMHRQCRLWSTKVHDLHTIIKQFVDALVVARGIKDLNELLMYLRSMELLVRSENAPLLADHINSTMDNVRKSLEGKRRGTHSRGMSSSVPPHSPTFKSDPSSPTESPTANAGGAEWSSPHGGELQATRGEIMEVARRRERGSAMKNIATIHIDGPSNVRGYTCDTETKRNQVKAIDDMIERHREQTQRKHLVSTGPGFSQPTDTSARKSTVRASPVDNDSTGGAYNQSHFSSVSRRMLFSAQPREHTMLRMHAPVPPSTVKK